MTMMWLYSMKPIKLYSEESERLQAFIDNRLDLLDCLMKKAESKINKLPMISKAKCMKVSYRYPALLFDFSLCNDVHSIISLSIVLWKLYLTTLNCHKIDPQIVFIFNFHNAWCAWLVKLFLLNAIHTKYLTKDVLVIITSGVDIRVCWPHTGWSP